MTYHIFIGYDEREHEVYQVAKFTLETLATVPVKIHKLHHKSLRDNKLFSRDWTTEPSGQTVCNVDLKPFSTQFSHTRFLVPELWRQLEDPTKSDLVMFVDCDFLFLEDVGELFKSLENTKGCPVHCVKHNYKPPTTIKMDNITQTSYNMKLWSAMVVYDMTHPDNAKLTPKVVNTQSGKFLHSFGWVSDLDTIGTIDEKWHFVPNHSEANLKGAKPAAIHYTEGGPWFTGYKNCRYSQDWLQAFNSFLNSTLKNGPYLGTVLFDLDKILHGE